MVMGRDDLPPPPEPPDAPEPPEPEHYARPEPGAADRPPTGRTTRRPPGAPKPPARPPGRPRTWEAVGEPISLPTVDGSFTRGYLLDSDGNRQIGPDGNPARCIIRQRTTKDGNPYYRVIHTGDVKVLGRHLAYEITSNRRLRNPEWCLYVVIEITDRHGITRTIDVAAMDLKQTQPKANWIDRAGVTLSGQISSVGDFIKILSDGLPDQMTIQGQGAYYADDGTPSCQLSKKITFACRSIVFDETGDIIPARVDLADIPDSINYYDLTPASEITESEIRAGIELFKLAYDECTSEYAAIPAAFTGQLMTSFISAVRPEYHAAVFLSGIKGSGKSKLAGRLDSIQARGSEITRGALQRVKPAVNLGDTRRTAKGPGYRVTGLAGFCITTDDVLKHDDNDFRIRDQSDIVSNLVRSMEAGGGPQARIDQARNKVVAGETPELHSNIKIMSEIPIKGDSTLERMIVLPHLTASWDTGHVFKRHIAETLTTADSRESQHRAYSAYVQWAFTRINELDECLEKALAETETWGVPARTQEKYAAVVAGNLMFQRFSETHDVDVSIDVAAAIAALRDCARRQSLASVPLAEQFAEDVRAAIIGNRIAFPGPPELDPDGREAGSFGLPYIVIEETDENGITEKKRYCPLTYRQLGLIMNNVDRERGPVPIPHNRSSIPGFLLPPRADTGGHEGHPLMQGWVIAIQKDELAELCRIISRDGRTYRPADVIRSLTEMNPACGARAKPYMPTRKRATIIDAVWLLSSGDDD